MHEHGMTEGVGKLIPGLGGKHRPVTGYGKRSSSCDVVFVLCQKRRSCTDAPPMPWGCRGVEFRGGLEGDVGYTTHSRVPWTAEQEARLDG